MGYYYPKSYSTAVKSVAYFNQFNKDYSFCIYKEFEQIYATLSSFSWTNAEEFIKFCDEANIRCDEIAFSKYSKSGMCDGAFLTEEYTYNAQGVGVPL